MMSCCTNVWSCSLVALTAVRDLFICAKHLFVAAMPMAMRLACSNAICGAGALQETVSQNRNKPRPGAGEGPPVRQELTAVKRWAEENWERRRGNE
jgi:hypothetical protein